ncbi:DUF3530 family protein [Sulfurirhabdus autotrophica]|uniref:Dienelactone hydrolase n=1 Tax=Sulfurirhabdus autotrophica TaxID=1706046 RepID=A0A4R3Y9J8_9PROT|nr:DUF3530 family protein [Sulfurirhabdus autotrophica]TCV89045.1 dienelactone hydrolase [Sulfurirhabdus autotrophica]
MRYLLMILLVAVANMVFAADYVREKKWADEITPGIVVGDPVYLEQKNHHKFLTLFTEAKDAKVGLIIVHGTGIHPDWGMIGTLRTQLADEGYTTLSVQMPVLAVDAKSEAYKATFKEAAERLQVAVAFLKAKGYGKVAIVSHSMGSKMVQAFLVNNPDSGVSAWAALGISDVDSFAGINMPVLDLYGVNDLPWVLKGVKKRGESLKNKVGSTQLSVQKADHFYTSHEAEMVNLVKTFMDNSL